MAQVESRSSKAIAEKMEQIEPGSPRHEVLEIARQFKTSWVDLGSKLWDVRRKKWYEEWGFKKFEDYCRDEIRIKPRTAAKLTASYAFLKTEEPAVLRRDGINKSVPDIQVVDMLRRARETTELPEKEYSKIKELALNDAPVAELRREIAQHRPPPDPPPIGKMIRQLVAQANRLADAVASVQGIPHVIVQRALALVDDLRALATPSDES